MEKLPKKIDIKVICLHDLPNFNLEKDKVYNAISYTKGNYEYYTILDHNGRERGWISIENFMTLEEARSQKLEDIGIL
jgi:hypothetical protein